MTLVTIPDTSEHNRISGYTLAASTGEENMRRWLAAIEAWSLSMRAAGRRKQTIELRRYQLSRLADERLHRSPWKVTPDEIVGWLAQHDWSPATRHSYLSAIRVFYKWAVKTGRTKRNPAADIDPVTVPRGVPHPTPSRIMQRALDGATDRDTLIILLAAYSGLRRAEIAGLRWSSIDDEDGEIRVEGKGGHVRVVPVHHRLGDALDAERRRRGDGGMGTGFRYGSPGSDYVFPGRNGRGMDPKTVGSAIRRRLGGEWTLHSLRHAFATRMLDRGTDLATVQDLLGHATPASTRVYTLVSRRAKRDAIDRL